MSTAYMSPSSVPDCCRSCRHYNWDSKDEYSHTVAYCLRNQIFPTRKISCKAFAPWGDKAKREQQQAEGE